MNGQTAYRGWIVLLLALMGLGFTAWLYQLSNGLAVTGMNNVVSWGLYIIAFMYFVGLSAGGLIVVAGAHLAGIQQLRPLARLAVILSGAAVIVAALFLIPDLGHPERVHDVLISGQFYSPLVWDVVVIPAFIIIAAVELWLLSRPRVSDSALTIVAMVSLPVAILLTSVDGWIFGLLVARPFWNSPLLAPMFISSALVSGMALLLVVTVILRKLEILRIGDDAVGLVGKLLAWFIAIDLFLLFTEVLTVIASNVPDNREQTMLLLHGRLAPFFWPEVILGGLVPLAILGLPQTRRSNRLLALAGALAVAGILLKRLNIMMASMTLPLIQLAPGQSFGRYVEPGERFWLRLGEYTPTWVEWSIAAGIVAFGAFLVTLGVRYLVTPPVSTAPTQAAVTHTLRLPSAQ